MSLKHLEKHSNPEIKPDIEDPNFIVNLMTPSTFRLGNIEDI
jgi:hypothetical protein